MASLNKTSLTSAGRGLIGRANAVASSNRTRRVAIGLVLFVIVIGLLGFFAAPPLIRHIAEQQISAQLGRPASIGRIALNPYTLSFEADRVHIGEAKGNLSADAKGGDFIDIERLIVLPSWSSLFRLAPVINELKIDSPRFHIVRYDAQRFNFSDLIEKFSKPSAKPSDKPARFSVSNIRIANGRIDFDDRLQKTQHVIDQWSVGIPFIANLPSTTELFVTPSLQARIDGSPLFIKGRTKPFAESRESEVALQLDGLDVPQLVSYAPASLPVAVKSGKLSTNLDVSFSLNGDAPVVRIKGTADLADIDVTDKQDAPLFAAQSLHVNAVNLEPLRNVYQLTEIKLAQPDIKLSRDKSGAFNFQKLSGPPADNPPAAETKAAAETQPLDLSIKHVAIDQGQIAFNDNLMAQPAQLGLKALDVTLDDFSTLGKAPARYTLKTALDHGGTLAASGGFTLPGKNADAKLALAGLPLPPLQPYVANALAARVSDGALSANLPLHVDWSKPEASIQVSAGDVSLKSLKLVPTANTAPVALASAEAKITKIDVAARTAALESVTLNGLSIDAKRLKDGSIDLAALAGPHEAAPEVSATHKIQKTNAAGPAWRYQIAQVSLADSTAEFTDETTPTPVKLHIAPLQVNVKQVTDDLTKPLAVDGKLTLNGNGALATAGTLTIKPLSLALHLDASQLDAAAFEPYFGSALNASLSSALLTANGDASFSGEGRTLKAGYKGDVSLSNVRLIDRVSSQPLAGWKLLGLTKLNARYDEKGADVEAARVTFANFYGRVLLDAQGKLNLRDVVVKDKTGIQTVAATPAPAASAPATSKPASTSTSTSPTPNLRFGELVLQNGRVTYTDNFIKPNFTANLVAITGTIGAFGTHSTVSAPVDVAAKLNANGPVSIKGTVNPLIAKPALDLTASAHDVELPNISPYSTKYAGYPITKGKLNVDLHYQLADDKLSANNHLFIDQLTFGDHVDNSTATKLPVRLAVSLLKNSRGEIDVNIPISGSLSNPEFSVGALVWKAIVNLLERAVTAPFSLLANAFGGGKNAEELGYVEFDPGSSTLSDASKEKLDTIAKALADKPSIKMDLSARVDPAVDEPGLRAAYVDRQVKLAKMKDSSDDNPNISPSTITLSADEYTKFLTKAYKDADFKKPRNMIGLTKTLPDADMKAALAANAPIDEGALGALAQKRATAVKTYFDGKIDSKRIFIVSPHMNADGIKDKGAPTRVDFGLQ
ncbi:AsmA family protein [Burkholderia sp. Leaf177]|uniref:DUF748 domain-containing protein n=1 Tax=Burkholderia sp. Leaf177 TaxID=1736287 RepID=UPI0006FD53DA|nr:DUF748 domain-containing protein [Burkholderia sp. Leaf177]KQR76350.1 AsmA family protein [Burkholderia sp. Leaf177]